VLIGIVGPTGSGKSEVGLVLAERLGAAIVSVDSMQVYRGMDIGTAKPSRAEQERVPHHLIDLVEPEASFSILDYRTAATPVLERLQRPLLVGGSGLYLRALVDEMSMGPTDPALRRELSELTPELARQRLLELDPAAAAAVDLANPRRVTRALEIMLLGGLSPSAKATSREASRLASYASSVDFTGIGFDPGSRLTERLGIRLDQMLADGFLAEVAALAPRLGPTAAKAAGYRQLLGVVRGEYGLEKGRRLALAATVEVARRQRTFLRADPRIRWLDWDENVEARVSSALGIIEEMVGAWSS